jgi:hypothetical protein
MILVTIARACDGPMLEGKSGPCIKSRAGFPVHILPKLKMKGTEEAGFCIAGGFCVGEGVCFDSSSEN